MNDSMYYAMTAIVAIILLVMQNHDIMFRIVRGKLDTVWIYYKILLYMMLLFHSTDVVWGVFSVLRMRNVLFVDTLFYFASMALCVLFWTLYSVRYVGKMGLAAKLLQGFSCLFCVVVMGLVIANIFGPVLFWIDENCIYSAEQMRWYIHSTQIVLLIAISIYCFMSYFRKENSPIQNRYRTIGWFGVIMSLFLLVQLWFPLLPLYTVGYMLGACMVRTFVVNDEKEEYKHKLEDSLAREKQQLQDLKDMRKAAYVDRLTGVKNKSSYVEMDESKASEMQKGTAEEFAVAVFDINGLKFINDNYGHEKGDEFIKSGCKIICNHFKHSPVYRIGGDEFAVLLEKEEYTKRHELQDNFNAMMDQHNIDGDIVVAMGMSDYNKESDYTFNDIFARADERMYKRKRELKNNKQERA